MRRKILVATFALACSAISFSCESPGSTGSDSAPSSDAVQDSGATTDLADTPLEDIDFDAIDPTLRTFRTAQVVSAYPARRTQNGWSRVCGAGAVDGLTTNVAFLTTLDRTGDTDTSVRPLDRVNGLLVDDGTMAGAHISGSDNVEFHLSCINPTTAMSNDCQGLAPTASLDSVRYVANNAARDAGHNILVLIDQSGSIGGLVRDGSYQEERIPNPLPQNFGEVASDRTGARLAAVRRLLGTLNNNDRFAAIAFSEALLSVPCTDAISDGTRDLDACFGTRRDIWSPGIASLQATTGGRSNLWLAVKTAYDYLRDRIHDTMRSNHILVLTDGPDTCAGERRLSCATPCVTADRDALVAQIINDVGDPNAPRIHISFVQFESVGYPGRDPRQVEVACESGGHYQFINSNAFPRSDSLSFQEAIDTAVANVRLSMMGHWELAAAIPAYQSDAGGGAGVPPGGLYGLQGSLTVRAVSKLVLEATSFAFGVGLGDGAAAARSWDRRPTIRKPCQGHLDCGSQSAPTACSSICSGESLTCMNGASAVVSPNLSSCASGAGFCCDGLCLEAGTCTACLAE